MLLLLDLGMVVVSLRSRTIGRCVRLLLLTVASTSHFSATDALAVVALPTAKSAIMAVLRVEEDDFTLEPAFPELFMATFRSQELRDQASAVSVFQVRPSLSGGLLGHSGAATPVAPIEVQPVEAPAVVAPPVEVPP